MATMLSHQTELHKALLTEHAGTYDPATLERIGGLTRGLQARGFDAASAKSMALTVLDRQISAQASVMAFSKIYLISGVLLVSALPLLLLWRTGRSVPLKMDAH